MEPLESPVFPPITQTTVPQVLLCVGAFPMTVEESCFYQQQYNDHLFPTWPKPINSARTPPVLVTMINNFSCTETAPLLAAREGGFRKTGYLCIQAWCHFFK